jgi:hypothetical protein
MDYEELAARAAVACWLGAEGAYARAIRSAKLLDMETLKGFLDLWKLARPNPLNRRTGLLDFLNAHAMPALKEIDQESEPSRQTHLVIEILTDRAVEVNATRGRPTSMLSKLALAICPLVFIPYDTRVRKALGSIGKGVKAHHYRDYMQAVLSEKPAFDRMLRERNLSAQSLNATGMSQALFELRALDKWMMLRGEFSPAAMARDIGRG